MTSKQSILEWFCREGSQGVPDCDKRCPERGSNPCFNLKELSELLDSYRSTIVASVPCEKVTFEDMASLKQRQVFMRYGWNNHCAIVEAWKQAKIKESV